MDPYPTTPDHATTRGRVAELSRLQFLLDRPAPAHVSIVGPKDIGKTLLLQALKDDAVSWDRFAAVALWDIRRHTPATDDAFFEGFATVVGDALENGHPTLAECLHEEPTLDMVQDVFEELTEGDTRVLLLVDHLDRALRQPNITKGLWDNLRALAIGGALTLVTATPKRLRELTDADSRTSEFWNVFAPPVELGPFSEAGLDEFLQPLQIAKGALSPPVRKEFERQTGGVPLLSALLADRLMRRPGDVVGKADVSDVGEQLAQSSDYVASLWDDTPAPAQALLVELAARGDEGVPEAGVPRDRLADLTRRGYVTTTSAGRVASTSRIVLEHASLHQASAGDLARLFGPEADTVSNTRALLELRLSAIAGGDDVLRNDAARAVRDLHPNPVRALGSLRDFAHAALDAIWAVVAPGRELDRGTVDAWYGSSQNWVRRRAIPLVEKTGYRIPGSRKEQEGVLNLLTDPALHGSAPVSDGTYRLLVAVRELGNYGHHVSDAGSEEVPFETAAAACALGIELFRRLAGELDDSRS